MITLRVFRIAAASGAALMVTFAARAEQSPYSTMRAQFLPQPVDMTISIEDPSMNLKFKPGAGGGTTELKPNAHTLWGLGVGYDGFSGTISLPMPSSGNSVRQKGSTDQFDLILHRYWSASGVDFFFESYRGFYVASDGEKDDDSHSFAQRPDVSALHAGANYYWVFSPERFRIDIQGADLATIRGEIEPGASLLGLFSLDYNRIGSDSASLDPRGPTAQTSPRELIQSGEFTTLAFGGGYGYNKLLGRQFFRSQFLMGAGPQFQQSTMLNGDRQSRAMLALKINMSIDYAFIRDDTTYGITLKYDTIRVNLSRYDLEATAASALMFARLKI